MPTVGLSPLPKMRFEAVINGVYQPAVGYKLHTYITGTTTNKTSYTDSTGGTANANPIILDANGEANIWLDGTYRLVLKTDADVQIFSIDGVSNSVSQASFDTANTTITNHETRLDNFERFIRISANRQFLDSDFGAVIVVNSASAVTLTIPTEATHLLRADWFCTVENRGAGTVTVVKSGSDVLETNDAALTQNKTGILVKHVTGNPSTYGFY